MSCLWDHRHLEEGGDGIADDVVDSRQGVSELGIEAAIVATVLVGAIPPEPVAALRGVDLFHCCCQRGRIEPVLARFDKPAHLAQIIPGAVLFGFADPGQVIRADPTAGPQTVERRLVGKLLDERAGGDGLDGARGGFFFQQPIDLVEELLAVVVVVLPGILAVEDDADEVRPLARSETVHRLIIELLADGQEAIHKIACRFLAGRAAVGEADLVAQHLVAENSVNLVIRRAGDIGTIKRIRVQDGFLRVAGEAGLAQAPGQYFLVGRHPLDAGVADHVDDLLRDCPLGRPHARGWLAEGIAVELYAAVDLFDRIQRVAEALRQLNVGNGLRSQVGVEEQRQDRMVERCGSDLDAPLVLQSLVERDHLGHQPGVLGQHSTLVFLGEVAAFGNQSSQRFLRQPVRVGPG